MAQTSQLVATFILNAVWQITAITALAHLCTKLLHRAPSRFSHGVWVAALGACLLIPTATVVLQHREGTRRTSEVTPTAQPAPAAEPSALAIPVSFQSLSRTVSFSMKKQNYAVHREQRIKNPGTGRLPGIFPGIGNIIGKGTRQLTERNGSSGRTRIYLKTSNKGLNRARSANLVLVSAR